MEYKCNIVVDGRIAGKIRRYTSEEPESESECLCEDATITYTARFKDGCQMDIKCCGVQFREGEANTAWTEAVLFDKEGREICFSEPSDEYFGLWSLDANGNTYSVYITSAQEVFEEKCYRAYQLDWMISHGHTLEEIFKSMSSYVVRMISDPMNEPSDHDQIISLAETAVKDARSSFLCNEGFNGSLFVCKEEFLHAEFQDEAYMAHLLSLMPDSKKLMEFWNTYYGKETA